MRPDQATDLAGRISQYWPRGLQTEIWEKRLRRYDYDLAIKALDVMADTLRHPPVIADFTQHYRAPAVEHVECDDCGGGGWASVHDDRRHGPRCTRRLGNASDDDSYLDDPNDCHCHAAEPCHCPAGIAVRPSYAKLTADRPPTREDAA